MLFRSGPATQRLREKSRQCLRRRTEIRGGGGQIDGPPPRLRPNPAGPLLRCPPTSSQPSKSRRAPAGFFILCPLPKQTDPNRDIPSPSWLSRAATSHFPKLVEPGCEERAARVETTLPKQTDPNHDTPSRSPPLSLPSPAIRARGKEGNTAFPSPAGLPVIRQSSRRKRLPSRQTPALQRKHTTGRQARPFDLLGKWPGNRS